jgi:hypothetical protein
MFHGIGQIFPVSQGAGIQGQNVTFGRSIFESAIDNSRLGVVADVAD